MNKECVYCKLRSKITCSPSACPLNRGINSIQNLDYSIRLVPNDKKDKPTYEELQQKVNQLETNRDEAIEYIKHSWWLRTDQTYDTSKDLQGWEVEQLLSILERGKE